MANRLYAPFRRIPTRLSPTGRQLYEYPRLHTDVPVNACATPLPALPLDTARRVYQDLLLSGLATDLRPVS